MTRPKKTTDDWSRAGPWPYEHEEFNLARSRMEYSTQLQMEALKEYQLLLAERLPTLIKDQLIRARESRKLFRRPAADQAEAGPDDALEPTAEEFLESEAIGIGVPSLAWNSAVVQAWSSLELLLARLVDYTLAHDDDVPQMRLTHEMLAGNPLEQLQTALRHTVGWQVEVEREQLKYLYEVRNLIVHENARASSERIKALQKRAAKVGAPAVVAHQTLFGEVFLTLGEEFAGWALALAERTFHAVLKDIDRWVGFGDDVSSSGA